MAVRKKWQQENRNLQTGDVVLLLSPSKLTKGEYRLGVIKETTPDKDGVVRTAKVGFRSRRRRAREAADECRVPLEVIVVACQRLADILPMEEKWKGGLITDS